jgi:hypothetical protein
MSSYKANINGIGGTLPAGSVMRYLYVSAIFHVEEISTQN